MLSPFLNYVKKSIISIDGNSRVFEFMSFPVREMYLQQGIARGASTLSYTYTKREPSRGGGDYLVNKL